MNKTLFRMAALLVALAVVLAAGRLWAESKEKKTAPRTRVGLVNLTYVIKNYDKYKHFQEEIKGTVEPFQKRDAKLRAQLDKLRKQAEKAKKDESTIVRTKYEDLEEKAKKIQREIEDNTAKAKKNLGKRSDDEMKLLFKDVEEAVKRYAASHDLDLVMHFNEAVSAEEYFSAPNIARKLNTGALMPMYTVPGIDISKDLVKIMNQRMRNERDDE
jgi:Skp family chaperone for outer membrane proteins